jgi:hypothetical protein
LKNGGFIRIKGVTAPTNRKLAICSSVSASGDGNASVQTDIPFPFDYSQLLEQVSVSLSLLPFNFWFISMLSFNIAVVWLYYISIL